MTITTQDIKFFKPEALDDTPTGGGRMTGAQVVDGELNNLFDDQSRFDRVTGRVSLRKLWCAVDADNADKLLGTHAIMLAPALDERVDVSMFARDDATDRRADAKAHLEQYLAAGATRPFYLWDTQPEGAQIVSILTELANEPPKAGDVLVLSVERGSVNVGVQQFCRITKAEAREVTQTMPSQSGGTKTLLNVDLTLSEPLAHTFPGEEFGFSNAAQQRTILRRTTVAAGKRYYSLHPIVQAITGQPTACTIDTPMTFVCPTAQQDTAMLDRPLGADALALMPTQADGDAPLAEPVRGSIVNGAVVYVAQRAITPGSVRISLRPESGGTTQQHILTDDGGGLLRRDEASGGAVPPQVAGTVDYVSGQVIVTGMGVASGALDASANSQLEYRPAAPVSEGRQTIGVEVTLLNVSNVWTANLQPLPLPGSVIFKYLFNGQWIELRDRADGSISGGANEGGGTINYASGSLTVTTGAQPDIGGAVLLSWGVGSSVVRPDVDLEQTPPTFVLNAEKPIKPGTLTLAYSIGGTGYSAADNAAGAVSGTAGSGTVDYAAGVIRLDPSTLPPPGTPVSLAYDSPDDLGDELIANPASHTLANAPVLPGSVTVTGLVQLSAGTVEVVLRDDGAGVLRVARGASVQAGGKSSAVGVGGAAGSVNYSDGAISLGNMTSLSGGEYVQTSQASGLNVFYSVRQWTVIPEPPAAMSAGARVTYAQDTTAQAEADAAVFDQVALTIEGDLLLSGLLPSSLVMRYRGLSYYDRAGSLFYRDPVTGIETAGGAVDYTGGRITLSHWPTAAGVTKIDGVLSVYGSPLMDAATWHTPNVPLRPTTYNLTVYPADSPAPVQVTADAEGVISGTGVSGTVNYSTGVYSLAFDPPIDPAPSSYNAIATTFVPLPESVIGINASRLPVDGRVPTVQQGDVAVLHHSAEHVLPNPVIAGQSYPTRAGIAALELRDATGARVPSDRYSFDRETGSLSMANPLDLDEYTQPLTAITRIEDMLLVSRANLSGLVEFTSRVTHDYPAEGAFLSTACPLGSELQARAFGVFSQAAWTAVWSDTLIGTPATGQYNASAAPIGISNAGAIRERWRVEFTSVSAFRVVGETVGQVGVGDVNNDCAPINPATGAPYFTLYAAGWSSGWSIGNQLRLNTEGAARPVWINRCTLPGPLTEPEDRFIVEFRGDAN